MSHASTARNAPMPPRALPVDGAAIFVAAPSALDDPGSGRAATRAPGAGPGSRSAASDGGPGGVGREGPAA